MLTAGMLLFTVVSLAPTFAQIEDLRDRRRALGREVARTEQSRDETERLIRLVREGDPLLLQRLAYRELRLRPVSAMIGEPIPATARAAGGAATPTPWRLNAADRPRGEATLGGLATDRRAIGRWTSGRTGRALILASVLLMGLGLLTSFRRAPAEED